MQQERDDRSGGVAQTPFAQYLRFGRVRRTVDAIEVKFNPYHDPRNGQFTFGPGGSSGAAEKPRTPSRLGPGGVRPQSAGSKAPPQRPARSSAPLSVSRPTADGSWRGGGFTGGGGGSFGGGGATARDGRPDQQQPSRPNAPAPLTPITVRADSLREVVRGRYVYGLDSLDRPRRIDGELRLNSRQRRSRSSQDAAGRPDRLATDEGGHYIARRFGGPTDLFNHFAQDRNFNRGAYASLEQHWSSAIKSGHRVRVHITPFYVDTSNRPEKITIIYFVDNRKRIQEFTNSPGGKK